MIIINQKFLFKVFLIKLGKRLYDIPLLKVKTINISFIKINAWFHINNRLFISWWIFFWLGFVLLFMHKVDVKLTFYLKRISLWIIKIFIKLIYFIIFFLIFYYYWCLYYLLTCIRFHKNFFFFYFCGKTKNFICN